MLFSGIIAALTSLLIPIIILLLLLPNACYVVEQQHAVIIERLGKFNRIVNAGFHVKVPVIDRKAATVSLRTMKNGFGIDVKTQDNVTIGLEVSAQYHVSYDMGAGPADSGIYKSYYMLQEPVDQMRDFITDALRSSIPVYTLDEVFAKKDDIAKDVNATVSEQMAAYGFTLVSTLITKIALPTEVENSMNDINAAQRKRAAAQELAEADRIKRVTDNLNRQGLRVVAVASKFLPAREGDYQRIDESDLILEGYIAFLDPPKETTAPALKALKASGITVKILTGDSELVTAKVCHEVGLDAGEVVVGSDIEPLSDDELAKLAQHTTLFARLTPMHKERIVTLLRREGHVVGFMGDGINDAPALRAADIGISVDGAVDIAREAADIILLEKSLMVLEEGVIEGRRTFANMLKYIKMTASSNFGNVFSVLVASAFLPFLPMLPLHLLIQNLMYDVSQVAIPFDNVDDEQIQKPQRWNPSDLGRFMLFFGPISSIFDILTFCLMWFVFHANTPEHQTLFQSGWFVVGLLSQTLIVHMIRTRRIPFIQSRAAWPLIVMTGIVMALGIALPFSPLASYLQLQALPLSYFPWLVAILAGYMVLTQMVKGFYARRYGWQ